MARRAAKHGSVFRSRLFGKHVLCLCEDEKILDLLKNDLVCTTQTLPPVIRFYEGPCAHILGSDDRCSGNHSLKRQIFQKFMAKCFGPQFWEKATGAIDAVLTEGQVSVETLAWDLVKSVLQRAVYGSYVEDRHFETFIEKLGRNTELGDVINNEIDRRLGGEEQGDDCIGCALAVTSDVEYIKTHVTGLMFNFITQVRPVLIGCLRGDLENIDENIQKYSVIFGTPVAFRAAKHDFTFNDLTIRKGTPVALGYGTLGVGFGADHHKCPAEHFSKKFIAVVIKRITQTYHVETIHDNDDDVFYHQKVHLVLSRRRKKKLSSTVLRRMTTVLSSASSRLVWLDGKGRWETVVSVGDLWRKAGAVAEMLTVEIGATRGDRILLCYAPGVDFYVSFWGCLRAGVIAVPVYPPSPAKLDQGIAKLDLIAVAAGARVCLTDDTVTFLRRTRGLFSTWPKDLTWYGTSHVTSPTSSLSDDTVVEPRDVAFLQFTSGSTGEPKGVIVGHDNLDHNVATIINSLNRRANSEDRTGKKKTIVSWLPAYHDLGLVYAHISPCVEGDDMIYMSPLTFLATPERWFDAATKYQATYLVAPDFGYRIGTKRALELLKHHHHESTQQHSLWDLSSIVWCASAAERVRPETYKDFTTALASSGLRAVLTPAYGLAESVVGVCGCPNLKTSTIRRDLVCCGDDLVEDVVIKIVDPETRRECRGPVVVRAEINNLPRRICSQRASKKIFF